MPKGKLIYLIVTLMFFLLLAYLGIRTLEHEVLLRQYQTQTQAKAQTTRVAAGIESLLQQKASRLHTISDFIEPDDAAALSTLKENDSDIAAVFTLRKNQLLYPDERQPLSNEDKEWAQQLSSLVNDPSQLISHIAHGEQETPQAGWFMTHETQEPLLIYWQQKGHTIIGFRLSYVQLMMDIANNIQVNPQEQQIVRVTENGRQLYQNAQADLNQLTLLDSRTLDYPLTTWQIYVYGVTSSLWHVWLWGSLLIVLLLSAVALLSYSLWREYTRTARQARQQVDFVSQVSHELKTPLTNITLYAELLREGLDDEQTQEQRYLDVITQEGQRLTRLIQNILTFTRAPKLHLRQVDISCLITEIAHIFTPALQARGMKIHITCPEKLTLQTDRDVITQIISNFMSNAEKYAMPGQQVDIQVTTTPEHIKIAVRDYGPGIAEKEMKMIFRPFYRVKSSITEGVSGTGIGLTIASQLAQRLQGEILVTAENPGVRFTLILPQG
ncbi:sensor histidine kinase [Citrobacter amalonaticus]|uniref:histidine kinase n=1 Tax=Citrobacter amalonaticus TaxID=35703 RepID=A0A2S4RSP0_CITAM|nr:HAMP domain-containing sensor histidine kinase [Citrobacter amalonaticus]POT54883.1 sensor histidine kinase [Citrobacter amalonaticus]POT70857.1 sensor histidine kinase [Citrobacter amalonaticus]POU62474.1 sensor histidine kinase [Citrobacter amalonaticus]POV02912.1 sensor histidine kinase [Citrobacter amalonaticus]